MALTWCNNGSHGDGVSRGVELCKQWYQEDSYEWSGQLMLKGIQYLSRKQPRQLSACLCRPFISHCHVSVVHDCSCPLSVPAIFAVAVN